VKKGLRKLPVRTWWDKEVTPRRSCRQGWDNGFQPPTEESARFYNLRSLHWHGDIARRKYAVFLQKPIFYMGFIDKWREGIFLPLVKRSGRLSAWRGFKPSQKKLSTDSWSSSSRLVGGGGGSRRPTPNWRQYVIDWSPADHSSWPPPLLGDPCWTDFSHKPAPAVLDGTLLEGAYTIAAHRRSAETMKLIQLYCIVCVVKLVFTVGTLSTLLAFLFLQ
jgi:hypothetical protein